MRSFNPLSLTERQARQFIEQLRWPKGAICPRCHKQEVVAVTGGRGGLYNCRLCRKQFTVTVGTIFEGSHIPLSKWVMAFHLLCSSKKGMSTLQLSRLLGITYKSAWHMTHRIRYVMRPTRSAPKLSGIVEVDETYVGGKAINTKMGRGTPNKTPVVAVVQRGGSARATPVKSVSGVSLLNVVQDAVTPNVQLMTDEFSSYKTLDLFYKGRQAVTHSKKEYVRGNVHTNTVESFFALLKRGIMGSYHHVSRKHLNRYCDEFAFRWSHRHTTDRERTTAALTQTVGRTLSFRKLTNMN